MVLELTLRPTASAERVRILQGKVDQAEIALFWQAAGTHTASWRLKKDSAGWSDRLETEVSVMEEQMQAGSVLELAIPEELLAAIPQ